MKKYEEHVLTNECGVDLQTIDDWDYEEGVGMSLPFVLTRLLEVNGLTRKHNFDQTQNGYWKLMLFHALRRKFYLCFTYSGVRESFVLYFIHGDKVNDERFIAKVWLEEHNKHNPQRKTSYLEILPLDKLVDVDNHENYLSVQNYLLLSYEEMSQFFHIEPNDDDPEYPNEKNKHTIIIPVQVEGIRQVLKED